MERAFPMLLAMVLALAAGAVHAQETGYIGHGMADASPTEVYLEYARVIHAADSPQAIFPFSPQPAAEVRAALAAMTPEQAAQALGFMQAMVPLQPEVLVETVEGDTATLEVFGELPGMLDGEPSPHHGVVTLVRRGGEWKISNQAFEDRD